MLGKTVRCPGCQAIFAATVEGVRPGAPPPVPGRSSGSAGASGTAEAPGEVPEVDVEVSDGVPEWEKPPLGAPGAEDPEGFVRPIAEIPVEDEDEEKRKKKKKKGKTKGYYDELMRYQRKKMKPHRGILILILGILGFTCIGLCGLFAWVMGTEDLNEIYSGRMDPSGETLTKVGRILGIVSVCLNALGIVLACGCGLMGYMFN